MKVRTVSIALTLLATAAVAVGAVATSGPHRRPLALPAASAFPDGPCRDTADAVLALGRFTYEHDGEANLPADAYPFLRQRAEDLAAVRKALAGPAGEQASAGAGGESATAEGAAPEGATAQRAGGAAEGAGGAAQTAGGAAQTAGGAAQTAGGAARPEAGDGPEQALSSRIDAVLTAIGFVRLRPGKAYDPQLLRDLEAARAGLQQTCVSRRD